MLSHNEDCETAAERIQKAIHELCYPHAYSSIANYVTVSQGVVSVTPTGKETLSHIYELVDQALYQAKTQGRDRYVIKQVNYS